MTKRKAFWLASATVGITAVVIWGILFYAAGWRMDEWQVNAFIILATIVLFTPLVYRTYLNRTTANKPTRVDYLKRAIVCGCLSIGYLILGLIHPQYGRGSLWNWMMPALWFLGAVYNLVRASKAEKSGYRPYEY